MDLVAFLENVRDPAALSQIYAAPYTAAALFRVLPPVAQQYVMRMLLLNEDLPGAVVSSWANPGATSKHIAALDQLGRLAVLQSCTDKLGAVSYSLNHMFRGQLRQAACTRLATAAVKVPDEVRQHAPSKEQADGHAHSQWESLLLFLGGSSDSPPTLPRNLGGSSALDVVQLLFSASLMTKDEQTHAAVISEAGFQFLLMDMYSQLWTVLHQYITDAQAQPGNALPSVISFLLQLGLQGSQPVCYSGLGRMEQQVAAHMAQLGLLVPYAAAGGMWLLPTRLAALMAGGCSGAAAAAEDGFVIVESNYRVYAYTTSAVQVSILRLFVRCDVLLPNLFVGTITRDSAMDALKSGISAEQIVAYLRQHAHPRVAGKVPVVPGVVADQIGLWQAELNRLKVERCTSYFAFETDELYMRAVVWAGRMGAALCTNDQKRQLVIPFQLHESMREELKALKTQLGL